MRVSPTLRKLLSVACLAWMVVGLVAVPAAARVSEVPPVKQPVEKVLYNSGEWATEHMEIDGQTRLIVQYVGAYQAGGNAQAASPTRFALGARTLLKGVYFPYAHPITNSSEEGLEVVLTDARGNTYGPYPTVPYGVAEQGRIAMQGEAGAEGSFVFREHAFVPFPEEEILLPPSTYTLQVRVAQGPAGVGAVLVKGVDYAAWKKYERDLLAWQAAPEEAAGEAEAGRGREAKVLGSAALLSAAEGEGTGSPAEKGQTAPPPAVGSGQASGGNRGGQAAPRTAQVTFQEPVQLNRIVFNTLNGGRGAAPGTLSIRDAQGKVWGTFRVQGAVLAGVANGAWVAAPGLVVPAGTYSMVLSDPAVVTRDARGWPEFAVEAVPAPPQQFDFTGRYAVDLEVFKTSTLAGPVAEGGSTFSLKGFELSVLDRGESLELVGRYEGVPFSQLCEVTSREEERVQGTVRMATDLRNLPYKAQVGAVVAVTLEKLPGLQPRLTINGQGTYQRVSGKYGNDFNTYRIVGSGSMTHADLPAYVAAALGARTGSVGNLPGPASPVQAATGVLFPPLAALAAHVIQGLLKPKAEKKPKLSVGEQAMADANKSLGQGLYDEKEAKAWAMMAEALANTDNPDDDPYSVGDNERPGGADYTPAAGGDGAGAYYEEEVDQELVSPQGEDGEPPAAAVSDVTLSGEGDEKSRLEAERDEWLKNLEESRKSADPNDPRAQELHAQYEEYIAYLNGRINQLAAQDTGAGGEIMTVQVDHTGRTADFAFDPQTGQWVNTETGAVFDMERYTKDVVPSFAADRAFIDEQRRRLETRSTEFDRAMDALVEDGKRRMALLGQLQKLRNQAYGIEPPAEGVGDVMANIDKLVNDLSNMDLPVADLAGRGSKIARVIIDRTTGRTLGEEQAAGLAGSWSWASILANTANESAQDVITGRTWAGMAGRAGLAMLTGGGSEYVLSPAEALMDIKDSLDQGESAGRATLKAMGKYVLGELGGEYLGEAWKRSGWSVNPELLEKAAAVGNTPVSELLGWGGKSGAKGSLQDVVSAKSKLLLEGLDSSARPYKASLAPDSAGGLADDVADYSTYRAGVRDQASVVEGKIQAGEELSPDDIRKVLRDPSVSRELKNAPPDVQNAYQDALEQSLYNPAKNNTASRLEQDLLESVQKEFGPDARVSVEIESIRTPGARGSRINADHDLTGKITITDAAGNTVTREIPADKVSRIYHEEFADAAGMLKNGEFDVAKAKAEMPEGITITGPDGRPQTIGWEQATREQQLEAFARKHGQEVTDVRSAEAAVDFNAARNETGVSNVAQLKEGVATARLVDPEGLAKMEQYKINNYFNKGGLANQTEAYEQLAKMGKLTNDLTGAYQKLGYPVSDLPADMQQALEIAANRNLSPGTRTLELQKLGFDGPGDLANKLSARIEGMQKLGAPRATQPGGTESGGSALDKAWSSIVSSFFTADDR